MMQGTNPTGGFNFGQPQTAPVQNTNKSLFAAPTSGGFSFGTAAPQATAQPQQQAAATGTMGFGTSTTPGGFSLGQPAATSAPGGGFSLSATNAPAPATTTSGFSFGVAPTTTTSAPGGFGLPTATSAPGGFGLPTATSAPGGFGLPTATSAPGGFGLPTATSAPGGFGLPTATSAPGGFGLPTASILTANTTGLPFGTPRPPAATTTATATLGFFSSQGAPAPTSTPSILFSGGTATPAITTAAVSTVAAAVPISSLGLGGAQPPSASTDANSSGSKTSGKSTKDTQLSQDLLATIAVFESRKNAENAASEENIRQTAAPYHKIGEKAKEIQKVLAEIASDHLQLKANTSNLKGEVMKEAEHVEMAKRTKETPMALQGDNKAPEIFFINLVRSFEAEMMYCRTKIDEVSQCMQAASNPCETEEDIAEVLQREHDTLKDLAAKVYAKHSQLVELSQLLKTKMAPNEQEFFRPQAKENTKAPASSVVRPVLAGGGSGLLAFQEQQQRAKAVTLGAAPPTLPLAHTTAPSMFSGASNTFGPCFGNSGFGLGTGLAGVGNTPFGAKPLFGSTPTNFGNTTIPAGLQQTSATSPFTINSPFNTKPFGTEEDDGDSRRKRRL